MRGISCLVVFYLKHHRFNPAYAGNMKKKRRFLPPLQVQPRVCGEYSFAPVVLVDSSGSTPRMRGIWILCNEFRNNHRFTPAYAGNIKSTIFNFLSMKVHPRVCGEYICVQSLFAGFVGSPPRMRGIWCASWLLNYIRRFTPAYAGNIFCWQARLPFGKVHPRVCGEYWLQFLRFACLLGSPPRMRGIFLSSATQTSYLRFTPAYAGNMVSSFEIEMLGKVHPRVCGEYYVER